MMHYVSGEAHPAMRCAVKVRYKAKEIAATLRPLPDGGAVSSLTSHRAMPHPVRRRWRMWEMKSSAEASFAAKRMGELSLAYAKAKNLSC